MIKPAKFESQRHNSIAHIVLFACLFFCSSLRCLFAADIEISKFDIVSTNVSTNIVVTLTPSPVMEEESVCLNLHLIEGTGAAVFMPGGHTSTNISQSSILQIIGNQLSSVESNMVLEAKVREMVVVSNIFTVVDMATGSKATTATTAAKKDQIKTQERMINKNQAIEIAEAAIKGRIKTQEYEGAPITVELKDRDYIVTFGYNRPKGAGEGFRGPGYAAKVILDAFTGSVKNIGRGPN